MTGADDSTFFSIATALIPALLLAGLVSEARPKGSARPAQVMWIMVGGGFALIAEAVAINAAITGDPGSVERFIVVLAVVLATALVIILSVRPWVRELPASSRTVLGRVGVGALVALAIVCAFLLDSAVRLSSAQEQRERAEREFDQTQREFDSYTSRIEAESRDEERYGDRLMNSIQREDALIRQLAVATDSVTREAILAKLKFLRLRQRFTERRLESAAGEADRLRREQAKLFEDRSD